MEKGGQSGGTKFYGKQLATRGENFMYFKKFEFIYDIHSLDCFLLITNIRFLKQLCYLEIVLSFWVMF